MTKAPINTTKADRQAYLERLRQVYATKPPSSENSFVKNGIRANELGRVLNELNPSQTKPLSRQDTLVWMEMRAKEIGF